MYVVYFCIFAVAKEFLHPFIVIGFLMIELSVILHAHTLKNGALLKFLEA